MAKKKIKRLTNQIIKTAKTKPKKKKISTKTKDILSSGSTLLNLACTDNPFGAFTKGKYYFLVGDSSSGKTFLSMTCLAEALQHPTFKDYRFIYDNVEDGNNIDLENLFNKKVADKVEAPAKDEDGDPMHSAIIEEFYYNLDDAIKEGKPFIYILDSMDGLDSEEDNEKFEKQKEAYKKGKQISGSYGMSKAKTNSTTLRKMINRLKKNGSILIIISQTRANIGFGFKKKTRSGGKSLRFYATIEIWNTVIQKLTKTVKGKKRTIGTKVKLKIEKNRITGGEHEVEMCIYPSYGIDDIGSCVDYLVDEKWWSKKGSKIKATEFDIECSRKKLISHIEEKGLVKKLQMITGKCWNEIKEACALERKSRY